MIRASGYVRNEPNLKLPRALNRGFSLARGQYLTWTSDDNLLGEQAIEKMVARLQGGDCDLVYADYYGFVELDAEARPRDPQHVRLPDKVQLEKGNHIGACFLYTRKVYEAIGDYDPELFLVEDYDYFIRAAKRFSFCHIAEPLYYFRHDDDTLTLSRFAEIKASDVLMRYKNGLLDEDGVLDAMVNLLLRNPDGLAHPGLRTLHRLADGRSYRLARWQRQWAESHLKRRLAPAVPGILKGYDAAGQQLRRRARRAARADGAAGEAGLCAALTTTQGASRAAYAERRLARPGPGARGPPPGPDSWARASALGVRQLQALCPPPADPDDEAPIFLLSAGWRSGSTMLQRLLMSDPGVLIWGEPYDECGLMQALAGCAEGLPPRLAAGRLLLRRPPPDELTGEWVANLFPSLEDWRRGQRALFDTMFAEPAQTRRGTALGHQGGAADGGARALPALAVPEREVPAAVPAPAGGLPLVLQLRTQLVRHCSPTGRCSRPRGFGAHWRRLMEGFLDDADALGRDAGQVRGPGGGHGGAGPIDAYLGIATDHGVMARKVRGTRRPARRAVLTRWSAGCCGVPWARRPSGWGTRGEIRHAMDASIVVCTYNRAESLRDTLRALRALQAAPGRDVGSDRRRQQLEGPHEGGRRGGAARRGRGCATSSRARRACRMRATTASPARTAT